MVIHLDDFHRKQVSCPYPQLLSGCPIHWFWNVLKCSETRCPFFTISINFQVLQKGMGRQKQHPHLLSITCNFPWRFLAVHPSVSQEVPKNRIDWFCKISMEITLSTFSGIWKRAAPPFCCISCAMWWLGSGFGAYLIFDEPMQYCWLYIRIIIQVYK